MIHISCVIVWNGWYHCGIAVHLIYFFWSWLGRVLLPRFGVITRQSCFIVITIQIIFLCSLG